MDDRMTLAIIILVSALVGFGSGWGVKNWKDGAEIAQVNSQKKSLESQNTVLTNANTQCATDIEGAKKGVAVIVAQVEEREKAASEAMKQADLTVAEHKTRVKIIRALPAVAPNMQCAAVFQEQIAYVQERKHAD